MNTLIDRFENSSLEGNFTADLMIAGITSEPRCWDIHRRYSNKCQVRWLIVQADSQIEAQALTTDVSTKDNSSIALSTSNIGSHLNEWLDSEVANSKSILVDVSCMSRPVMAEVFAALLSCKNSKSITITVAYVIAAFTPPPETLPPNEDIRPVTEAFAGWPSEPAAGTTLIVGLGYEQDKARGACEYFDPSDRWIFSPQSPIVAYDEAVHRNNAELVSDAQKQHRLCSYPVDDPTRTFGELVSVVSQLSGRSNPVILPFGPKIFFAVSLIVASVYSEVGIWHVTGDLLSKPAPDIASEHTIVFTVVIKKPQLSAVGNLI